MLILFLLLIKKTDLKFSILSKAKSKYIRSLFTHKYRQKYNKYIAEGDKICKEILISKSSDIQFIVADTDWIDNNASILKDFNSKVFVAKRNELTQISQLSTPSSVLIVADIHVYNKPDLKNIRFSIFLDGVRNPGNLGAILRIADWYGIKNVFVSEDCVDQFNAKVLQSSMGSFLRVHVCQVELQTLKNEGFFILGATLNGVEEIVNSKKTLLVIGNEGKGIKADNLKLLDQEVSISSKHKLGAESLNAAVATGIFCDRYIN